MQPQAFPRLRKPQAQLAQSLQGVKQLKYSNILQTSFVYLLVGRPGSGQSHMINQMILNPELYYKKFNKIVYVSPSRVHQDLKVDNQFYSQTLDQDFLQSVIIKLSQRTKHAPTHKYNILFVLDDCVAALNHIAQSSMITNLFFNRRHLIPQATISIIVTTQDLKSICAKVRNVVTGFFLFSPTPKQIQFIKHDVVYDKQLVQQMLQIHTKYFTPQLHEFYYIQTLPKLELFYNFLKVY